MMLTIQELYEKFMNLEYKWYIVGAVALLILFIIILCIPKKKKANKEKEVVEEIKDSTEEAKPIEEKKEEKVEVTEEVKPIEEKEEKIEATEEVKPIEEKEEKIEAAEEVKPIEEKKEEKTEVVEEKPQAKIIKKADLDIKIVGKWIIKRKSPEDFVLYLVANNGEVILASESYVNIAGARLGLQTLKKNIALNHFQIHCDKNNHYFFKLKDSANKLLGMGQIYPSKRSCQGSINSVKKFAQNSELTADIIDDMTYIKYEPKEEINVENVKDAYRGKWIIKKIDAEFQASLHASNGEILLVTECYASTNSVYNAIEAIKKNVEASNFIIDIDKNKKSFYRLRNINKLTLAIGEAYDKQASCINSIESVKRFCLTADITEQLQDE